jgi:hypothetical protein
VGGHALVEHGGQQLLQGLAARQSQLGIELEQRLEHEPALREAGIDASRASNMVDAGMAVEDAVARAFADEGLEAEDAHVAWSAGAGLGRDGIVEVEVTYPVTVLQAPLLGQVSGPSIWVRAAHSVRIDPYRSVE